MKSLEKLVGYLWSHRKYLQESWTKIFEVICWEIPGWVLGRIFEEGTPWDTSEGVTRRRLWKFFWRTLEAISRKKYWKNFWRIFCSNPWRNFWISFGRIFERIPWSDSKKYPRGFSEGSPGGIYKRNHEKICRIPANSTLGVIPGKFRGRCSKVVPGSYLRKKS